jgi:hypothetical protein
LSEARLQRPSGASHPNVDLINKLYTSLMNLDADAAASCYAPDAHFEDIAFRLDGRERIRDMWRMVCIKAKPTVTFDSVVANDTGGSGHWVARYTIEETGNRVTNDIVSEFVIERGFIRNHRDKCNALKWGWQAYGFPKGLVAGLVSPVRQRIARKKLDDFVRNPGPART